MRLLSRYSVGQSFSQARSTSIVGIDGVLRLTLQRAWLLEGALVYLAVTVRWL